MDFTEMGQAMREARKSMRLTQEALAAMHGMSRNTVAAIEKGTVPEVGIRKVMALCTSLGLEMSLQPKRGRPTLNQLRKDAHAERTGR